MSIQTLKNKLIVKLGGFTKQEVLDILESYGETEKIKVVEAKK